MLLLVTVAVSAWSGYLTRDWAERGRDILLPTLAAGVAWAVLWAALAGIDLPAPAWLVAALPVSTAYAVGLTLVDIVAALLARLR